MDFITWLNQTWFDIVTFAGGVALLVLLGKNLKTIKKTLGKPFADLCEHSNTLQKDVNDLKNISEQREKELTSINKREKDFESMFVNITEALLALMRDKINSYFNNCNDKGYITPSEIEIVSALFASYHKMGGNGLIAKEMEIINKFPVCENQEDFQHYLNRKK